MLSRQPQSDIKWEMRDSPGSDQISSADLQEMTMWCRFGAVIAIYKVKIDLNRINKNRNKEPALKDYTVHFQSHFLMALTGSKPNKQFISACLYGDCFRSLTGGKVIKYVLHYLLFLALFKMLELCKVPVGVSEEGTQNTEASVHREPLPWHICTGEGDLSCFWRR